jgi:hypothetical protein
MNIRNGMTVHQVGKHEGQDCVLSSKTYDSLNQAKKANGLNARTMQRGEKLPPTKAEVEARIEAEKKAKEEAEAVAA